MAGTKTNAQEPQLEWVKRIGSNTQLANGSVCNVDNNGNSYCMGIFLSSSLNLDGVLLQSVGASEIGRCGYIAKYNAQGQMIWAKKTVGIFTVFGMATSPNTDKILVDTQGNIYISGEYRIDQFNQHCKIDNYVLNIDAPNTFKHSFLAKLSAQGEVLWVKTSKGTDYPFSNASANDIHFDLDGNINVTGFFWDSVTFSPQHTLSTSGINEKAVYLTKYSTTGEIILCRKLDGTVPLPVSSAYSNTEQVKRDALGNLYRWSNNDLNKTLYKYDYQGNLLSTKILDIYYVTQQGTSLPNLQGFAIDNTGNVYISGNFFGSLILENQNYPGLGSAYNYDAVLIKLNAADLNVDWVQIPLLTPKDSYNKLLTDDVGNIYAIGQNDDASENRMLLKKYNSNGTVLWSKIVTGQYGPNQPLGGIHPLTICETNNGGNIWVSGTFRVNANFGPNAHFTTPSLNHFNGFLAQYGTCNTEQPTVNMPQDTQICAGETIQLSANFTNPALNYRWNTGATTPTITVNQPGTYYVIAQESSECYGKSQEIAITPLPAPQAEVQFAAGTFTATAQNVTYQWIDCTTQTPIEGQTTSTFTPSVAGSYALKVTNSSGCSSLSACRLVTQDELGLSAFNAHDFVLYPNPAKDILTLKTDLVVQNTTIFNTLGQEIMEATGKEMDVSNLPSGNYMIKITTESGVHKTMFIKQ